MNQDPDRSPQWCWTLDQQIPSSLDTGHAVIEKFLSALTDAGWDGRDYFQIQLAVEEAVVNAIKHGNKESPDKEVHVEMKIAPDQTWVRLTDQGEGFDFSSLPDPLAEENIGKPHGRGVMLIRELMSEIHYNARGNQLTMQKARSTE